ncbi:MAG TPA: SGNH/GDSL hydrolase family protein, partial [Bacteroidota bacterium]|nr:SGNH/GDSL hydrolase family protein [Bacteroidota bacterium]
MKKLGISLILVGLVFNPIIAGYLFSSSGKMTGGTWFPINLLLEMFFIAFGVFILNKSSTLNVKLVFFYIVMIASAGVIIEFGLHVIRRLFSPDEKRIAISIYKDQRWARDLLRECGEIGFTYSQYLGWRSEAYDGKYLHVDRNGIRKTVQFKDTLAESDTILVFGGSTVWGTNVRDEGTIPSFLATYFGENGSNVTVVNHGERGYNFTQEVLKFILLLREGSRARIVVFYDGANDILTAYAAGQAGVAGFTPQMQRIINEKKHSLLKQVASIIRQYIENHSMIFQSIDRIVLKFSSDMKTDQDSNLAGSASLNDLSSDIVDEYRKSYALLDSVARMYRIDYRCLLQPVIFFKVHPTDEELNADEHSRNSVLSKLYKQTYARIDSLELPRYNNLSHLFDSSANTLYFDYCHVPEEGNA